MTENSFIYDRPLMPDEGIKREDILKEVIPEILRGSYYIVLGPKKAGKTTLLYQIKEGVEKKNPNWRCIYIDLAKLKDLEDKLFYLEVYKRIREALKKRTQRKEGISHLEFKSYIERILIGLLDKRILLLLDGLESLDRDLGKDMAMTLRNIFSEREIADAFQRLTVVIGGNLGLLGLTIGKTSPFYIAKRILLQDLNQKESYRLIEQGIKKVGLKIDETVKEELFRKTEGTPYLLQRLCYLCVERVKTKKEKVVTSQILYEVIHNFLKEDAYKDTVLISMASGVEKEPDLLKCLVGIMEGKKIGLIDPGSDIDRLELSGAVVKKDGRYQIHNEIYGVFLKNYFNPMKLGEIFSKTGDWKGAIQYYGKGMEERKQELFIIHKSSVLLSLFNLMYLSENLDEIYDLILKGLGVFLDLDEVHIYTIDRIKEELVLERSLNRKEEKKRISILREDKSLELRALFERRYIVEEDQEGTVIAIPIIAKNRVLGLVKVKSKKRILMDKMEINSVVSFMEQVAVAIQNIQNIELLKKVASMKADVAAIMSGLGHELSGILPPLYDAIKRGDKSDGEKMVNRLINIDRDLRDYRRTMGKFNFSPSSIKDIIKDVVAIYSSEIEKNSIIFNFNFPENELRLNLDSKMMRLAVSNIIFNAIDAIKIRNPEKKEIEITISFNNGIVEISFKDNGCGIMEEDKEEIFKEWTSSKEGGTGLGLPLAKRIIEEHRGRLYLKDSKYNEGSTFVIELPIKEE